MTKTEAKVPPTGSALPKSGEVEEIKTTEWVMFVGLMLATVWAYWPTLETMFERWGSDPQYSHGYLVPLFSLYLLWAWRDSRPAVSSKLRVLGAGIFVAANLLRFTSAYFFLEYLEGASLVLAVGGIVLLCFGWGIFRWSLAPVGFLLLMVPLPFTVSTFARRPLRRMGTIVGTYLLQVLGFNAFPRGNVIELSNSVVGVAEACSGLRMLMIFVALAFGVALLSQRPLWERVVIVLSSVPIALVANILRIVMTAVFFETFNKELAEGILHDLAGFAMMPLGLLMLGIEAWILARILIIEQDRPLVPVGGGRGSVPRSPVSPPSRKS
ncbi:MAG: exosortase/archaeosortase family protein [Planctomycetota bacterium]|nr:exosortase/archaeosortase family protein [Planctomycetota bacterium]